MTIAVKQAAFGVAHRTVKIKINSYSTMVPNYDIYVSFMFPCSTCLDLPHDSMLTLPSYDIFSVLKSSCLTRW